MKLTKSYITVQDWSIRASPSIKDIIQWLWEWNYVLSIDKEKKIRSPLQNRYYWGVFLPHLTETGYTVEELHELFKKMFLSKQKRLSKFGRRGIQVTRSTTELSTVEFEEYIDKIRAFALDYGYVMPYPNE